MACFTANADDEEEYDVEKNDGNYNVNNGGISLINLNDGVI